jgi:hypothetical protein
MLPSLADLRKLEYQTLRVITEVGEFGRIGELQAAAKKSISLLNEYNGPINIHLGFVLDIRLRSDKRRPMFRRRVDVGAAVQAGNNSSTVGNASYSLIICRGEDPASSPIVRKLHFDYEAAGARNIGEPKPTVHMQVCGKLSPHHAAVGYSNLRLQAMYPGFEKPRIPVAPTCVAMMLNWLFLEFQTDPAAQTVLRNHRWRKLVAEAERAILAPYYDAAANFLKRQADISKRFCQTHLYELSCD